MLHVLTPDSQLEQNALATSGSFAWWYADALDADLNGFVCIWSWGLPFLPGLASALRAGRSLPGESRPSFNLVIYERGVPTLYVLQEHVPDTASHEGGVWRFGDTHIERVGDSLIVKVDCAVPGSTERLRGTLQIDGTPWHSVVGAPPIAARTHGWSPQLGPSHAVMQLTHASTVFHYDGPAYADRNEGDRPLHDLGISRWVWGRSTFIGETRIAYVLWPEDGGPPTPLAIRVSADGQVTVQVAEVVAGANAVSAWGEATPKTLSLTVDGTAFLTLTARHQVDNSPFYARAVGVGAAPELGTAPAMMESCTPSRIDPGWFRPLLRMATHRVGQSNSRWLPLFNGPRDTRWSRLFASWRGVGTP